MEAETDGMKSAALWRGSPGAKILLSHIPTNPTRRLGSLSHHSKDPHGSLHPPLSPFSSVSPLQPSLWPLCIAFLLFYPYIQYVYIHILTCIVVGHLDLYKAWYDKTHTGVQICLTALMEKEPGGLNWERWPLLWLQCKKSYSVNIGPNHGGKTVQSIYIRGGRHKKLFD